MLLARLAGAIAAPMQQMAGLLQALPRNLAYGLSALLDTKQSDEPAAAPAPAVTEEAPAEEASATDEAPAAEPPAPASAEEAAAPEAAADDAAHEVAATEAEPAAE